MSAIQLVDTAATVDAIEKLELNADMKRIFEHLAEEGFRPSASSERELFFKYEGWRLNLEAYPNDSGYQLFVCACREIEVQDTTYAVMAANLLNTRLRYIKLVMAENRSVWVSYETLEMDVEAYLQGFIRVVGALVNAAREFGVEFRKQLQPMTIN